MMLARRPCIGAATVFFCACTAVFDCGGGMNPDADTLLVLLRPYSAPLLNCADALANLQVTGHPVRKGNFCTLPVMKRSRVVGRRRKKGGC